MVKINPISPIYRDKKQKHGKQEREHWAFQYGTDAEYRAWIRKQPSCISGRLGCESAHWRSAATSGTGYKAPYSCIPLTPSEHLAQHQHGSSILGDRNWWEQMVFKYLNEWVRHVRK